ncbi:alpha/beta fold hydrolase [Zavarzinia sp. CC-PAN008]|uniref:alpha/beta fold hydrolase n=1 Tax=Zavarzinia sp. CC-PAN008 TaxID=3243332 RepID=UPI003F744D50
MSAAIAGLEPIVGRYFPLELEGRHHRVYFEEAGQGIPLVCLHTAGSDGRQYRAILNDPEITARFRVLVFDLPWHGKSSPPVGWQDEVYQLTTDRYVGTVMAFCRALGLDRPVVMGCSIGGRAVLHLALRHANDFRAAIGLQSALHAESAIGPQMAETDYMHRPDVHGGEAAASAVSGLIAPQAPPADRWETLWHYSQGGPGVFPGDLYYYFVDGDLRNGQVRGLDTDRCPLYLLTGEYDYSASPEQTEEVLAQVPGAKYQLMTGLGHFPMSENPEHFKTYLKPILAEIAGATA